MELKISTSSLVVREYGTVLLLTATVGGATGVSPGRGGATDLHGRAVCSGVNSSQSVTGEVGENYIRLRVKCSPSMVKPRGLSPRYFTRRVHRPGVFGSQIE
ncbi:MAG: hypothetical protein J07HX5_01467 [halophilic archaeon J07HX5]|nr:MAG: hypothetical protein J07HX5_01467 [halophilic archaeon J07HX5]